MQCGPEWKQTSHELFLHIYPLIMKELLLNGKNEVSWICSDKIAGSCHPHWFPARTVPVRCDSQSMHHQNPVLPGVTALQQGHWGTEAKASGTSMWIHWPRATQQPQPVSTVGEVVSHTRSFPKEAVLYLIKENSTAVQEILTEAVKGTLSRSYSHLLLKSYIEIHQSAP